MTSNSSTSTAIRTFQDLRPYLSTPFRASFQVGEHPSLSITLYAVSWKRKEPHIATHGKHFGSIEHLFYHYNKYNAGSALDKATYVENGVYTPRVLEHLVFQEGPYRTLSVAKTLELSPDEWADLPALVPVDSAPDVPNTISFSAVQESKDSAQPLNQKVAELDQRCDTLKHSLEETRRLNAEALEMMETRLSSLEATIRKMDQFLYGSAR